MELLAVMVEMDKHLLFLAYQSLMLVVVAVELYLQVQQGLVAQEEEEQVQILLLLLLLARLIPVVEGVVVVTHLAQF